MADSKTSQDLSIVKLASPVSILMPICDERDVIEHVIQEWHHDVIQYLPPGSEMVFDDCSADGTYELLLEMQKKYPYIVVYRSKKEGFFKSAQRLYTLAKCPLVFFTDSDGQYVPREFWKIAANIHAYDICHGMKATRKDPFYRVAASGAFNMIFRVLFFSKLRDVNSAFRLMHKSLSDEIAPKVKHMKTLFNAELLIRAELAGYRVYATDVEHRERMIGKSRGLPLKGFLRECMAAYRGLNKLREEFRATGQAVPSRSTN